MFSNPVLEASWSAASLPGVPCSLTRKLLVKTSAEATLRMTSRPGHLSMARLRTRLTTMTSPTSIAHHHGGHDCAHASISYSHRVHSGLQVYGSHQLYSRILFAFLNRQISKTTPKKLIIKFSHRNPSTRKYYHGKQRYENL